MPLKQLLPIQPALQEHKPCVCLYMFYNLVHKLEITACNIMPRLTSFKIQMIISIVHVLSLKRMSSQLSLFVFFKLLTVVTMSYNKPVLTTSKRRYNPLTSSHGSLFIHCPIFRYLHFIPLCLEMHSEYTKFIKDMKIQQINPFQNSVFFSIFFLRVVFYKKNSFFTIKLLKTNIHAIFSLWSLN